MHLYLYSLHFPLFPSSSFFPSHPFPCLPLSPSLASLFPTLSSCHPIPASPACRLPWWRDKTSSGGHVPAETFRHKNNHSIFAQSSSSFLPPAKRAWKKTERNRKKARRKRRGRRGGGGGKNVCNGDLDKTVFKKGVKKCFHQRENENYAAHNAGLASSGPRQQQPGLGSARLSDFFFLISYCTQRRDKGRATYPDSAGNTPNNT